MTHGGRKELPKVYLTAEEAQKLLVAPYKTDPAHRLVIHTGLHGLRATEIINLQVKDVDLEERTICVRQGKGKKDRIVPATPDYCDNIRHYTEQHDLKPVDKLFSIGTRQHLYQIIRRYGKRSGLEEAKGQPITVHSLRHTYAVLSLKSGVNLRSLQMALGHASLDTTAIYLDLLAADLQEDYRNHPLPY